MKANHERIGEVYFGNEPFYLTLNVDKSFNNMNRVDFCSSCFSKDVHNTFIKFGVKNNKIGFIGMKLSPQLRGNGFGHILLETFLRIGESMNWKIDQTSCIRKPLMAKVLQTYGFEPLQNNIYAEVLSVLDSDIPVINLYKESNRKLKFESSNYFFQINNVIKGLSETPVIPFYTPFVYEGCNNEIRQQTLQKMGKKLQIFPRRIKKQLGL